MSPMGKTDILENHLSPQSFSLVTALLQTISIIHFIMKFLDPFSNHEISKTELEIHPLSFEMVQKAWTPVTIEAGGLMMRGCFPRFNILLHIVA
jgi:hypothetical protein